MLKTSLTLLTVLLLATSARADPGPAPAATPVAPAPRAAPSPLPPGPPLAPPSDARAARVPPEFMYQFLSYDEDAGVVVLGSARQRLTRDELYAVLDRPDLEEKSREAAQLRVILGVAAGALFLGGMVTAVVTRVGMPDLSAGSCARNAQSYNACLPDVDRREALSTVGLVAGISLGGLLGMLAYRSSPDVLSKDEVSTLISKHNAALLRRLRSERTEVRVAPCASARGAGVATVVTF
jgi:hypothetical protein